tara:strand:+ start:310 stop:762 length:453 start_codon:yes stop_codon:yes gene_type:complete
MIGKMRGFGSKPLLWKTYLEDFPNLEVAMVSDFNKSYNCIAWSIGVTDRWVWNEIDINEDGTANLGEFINFYAKHGYKPVFNEKEADVALFALKIGQGYEITHAAKRNKNYPDRSIWLSKMGQGGIIEHRGLSVFKDSPYGTPIALFARE